MKRRREIRLEVEKCETTVVRRRVVSRVAANSKAWDELPSAKDPGSGAENDGDGRHVSPDEQEVKP